MNLKINGTKVVGDEFAYEGCHKIYIIEDEDDRKQAIELGYEIHNIKELHSVYKKSCDLRFISNWKLDKRYVRQFETAVFMEEI